MANEKISAMPSGTTPAGTEVVPGVQGGANVTFTPFATQTAGDATNNTATTAFVAAAIAPLNPASSVLEATTTALPNTPTYNNGTAGVGATLTSATNTALSIDSVATILNGRYLVKNQASTFQNGIYTLTQVGTGSVPWILTRATDYNTPSNINYTGTVPVIAGTTNANTNWLLTSNVTTIGTSAITYASQSTPTKGSVVSQTSLTAYEVVMGAGGQNVITPSGVGTSGQVLTSAGAGAFPAFQNPIAQNTQTSSYQLVLSDANNVVTMNVTGAGTLTIPANASVAFPVGTVIGINNIGTAALTVAITTDTLETGIGGTLVTGSLTLPVGGTMSIFKTASTTWLGQVGNPGPFLFQKTVTSGAATSVIASSIPGGYSHIMIKVLARSANSSADDGLWFQFNSDTGSNYNNANIFFAASGTSPTGEGSNTTNASVGNVPAATGLANSAGQADVSIAGYSQTTFFKNYNAQCVDTRGSANTAFFAFESHGTWLSTSAITSVKVFLQSGSAFVNGSIVWVYLIP